MEQYEHDLREYQKKENDAKVQYNFSYDNYRKIISKNKLNARSKLLLTNLKPAIKASRGIASPKKGLCRTSISGKA
jgi:hypothetical protein